MHGTSTPIAHHAPLTAHSPVLEHPQPDVQEAGMGEAQKVSLTSSPRLKLFALFINVLVLMELTVAMYFAAQDQDRLTPVFFKIFFSLLAPTIIVAIAGRRIIARAERR